MRIRTQISDGTIRGSCSLFVCRCCRTKYGWKHQAWCDIGSLTEPGCRDCRYYSEQKHGCLHPAQKQEGRKPYEEDQRPL